MQKYFWRSSVSFPVPSDGRRALLLIYANIIKGFPPEAPTVDIALSFSIWPASLQILPYTHIPAILARVIINPVLKLIRQILLLGKVTWIIMRINIL